MCLGKQIFTQTIHKFGKSVAKRLEIQNLVLFLSITRSNVKKVFEKHRQLECAFTEFSLHCQRLVVKPGAENWNPRPVSNSGKRKREGPRFPTAKYGKIAILILLIVGGSYRSHHKQLTINSSCLRVYICYLFDFVKPFFEKLLYKYNRKDEFSINVIGFNLLYKKFFPSRSDPMPLKTILCKLESKSFNLINYHAYVSQ